MNLANSCIEETLRDSEMWCSNPASMADHNIQPAKRVYERGGKTTAFCLNPKQVGVGYRNLHCPHLEIYGCVCVYIYTYQQVSIAQKGIEGEPKK